ncbi:MAG: alpha-E domain-containing protein [Fimbriimonadaceae bacterium]|nr:alpha-E domain-containing protein [Fimbriimonadaceae bacterium]
MLSRHADAAFWIGRYVERAEATARMIDVHYHFGLESPYVGRVLKWESILAIADEVERYSKMYGEANERNILQFFAFDARNPNSISSCLRLARENGRSIRDQISSEMWESLNRTYLEFQRWNVEVVLDQTPFEFFSWVKDASHLFQGITSRTLMLSEAREFHDAGRYLERADQTARILDVKYHDLLPRFTEDTAIPAPPDPSLPDPASVGGPVDTHGWTAVLKSVGAFEAFRKTYRRTVTPERVTEFLILNPQFPASVRYSVGRVDGALRRISGNRELSPGNAAERAVGRLYNDLNYTDAAEIIAGGLHEFLESVEVRCTEIGDAIYECYLRY